MGVFIPTCKLHSKDLNVDIIISVEEQKQNVCNFSFYNRLQLGAENQNSWRVKSCTQSD